MLVLLDRAALLAVLLTPLMLLHAHSVADALIAVADVCFLLRSARAADWTWLRPLWMRLSLLWWGWLVVCSVPLPALGLGESGWGGFAQAAAVLRFVVLLAVMRHVLRPVAARRWFSAIIAAAAAWIAAQSLLQYATGRNLWGDPWGGDGELTGPFRKPRAGPPLARILFPALVPPAAALLARPGLVPKAGGYALLLAGIAVMVLIGQRMPLMLTGLGMVVCGVLLRQLRPAVLAAGLVGAALVAGSVAYSPPTYYRLVLKFTAQMDHFGSSQYGELYARAWEIGRQHPLTGRGVNGFRTGCPMPRYFVPTFDGRVPDGGGAAICASHPHNFYMEALDQGGFPGLALFSAAALGWLAATGRGLLRRPDPLRVGLFASVFVQLWPLASTSGFISMPMGGWLFVTLGWGIAEARWREPAALPRPAWSRHRSAPVLEAEAEPG
jgi:O-Antigen ligase